MHLRGLHYSSEWNSAASGQHYSTHRICIFVGYAAPPNGVLLRVDHISFPRRGCILIDYTIPSDRVLLLVDYTTPPGRVCLQIGHTTAPNRVFLLLDYVIFWNLAFPFVDNTTPPMEFASSWATLVLRLEYCCEWTTSASSCEDAF